MGNRRGGRGRAAMSLKYYMEQGNEDMRGKEKQRRGEEGGL